MTESQVEPFMRIPSRIYTSEPISGIGGNKFFRAKRQMVRYLEISGCGTHSNLSGATGRVSMLSLR